MRAKYLTGKQPKTLITDGLPSYAKACEQAFDETQHIRKITFKGKEHNNNKMEHLNGEIRDREKDHARTQTQTHANPSGMPNPP